MSPHTARLAIVVLAVLGVAILAGGWVFGRPALSRREDVAARRAAYRAFPTFPGATKLDQDSYEIKGDGVGTGEYGLTVTYRLPTGAGASEVIGFFRAHIPAGWHEASDETCAGVASRMPPPPRATVPPGAPNQPSPPTSAFSGRLVLIRVDGELAVFAPGENRSGVTFKVSNRGQNRLLTLDQVTFACHAAAS